MADTDCPSCADLRADADHWRGRYVAMLAAAKAGIAAAAPDGRMRPATAPVAGVASPSVCADVQPDSRALGGHTA